ncbi:MAG TPA: hypothetical protein PLS69_03025 [Terricaulis sp.]|nr:hypothetical protein [Terricaulis sp.]HRP11523.1 hypothetical protein [Terricaulis sp.]
MKNPMLAVFALGLAACAAPAQTPPAVAENALEACAARGGALERVGRAQTLQCVIPYADAGKSCTDGSQCEAGRCIGGLEDANPRENVTGQCQPTNMAFGCYTTITNGRTGAAICVD